MNNKIIKIVISVLVTLLFTKIVIFGLIGFYIYNFFKLQNLNPTDSLNTKLENVFHYTLEQIKNFFI